MDIIQKYEKLCNKSIKLNSGSNIDIESAHIHQDKVYRLFIKDIEIMTDNCQYNVNSDQWSKLISFLIHLILLTLLEKVLLIFLYIRWFF